MIWLAAAVVALLGGALLSRHVLALRLARHLSLIQELYDRAFVVGYTDFAATGGAGTPPVQPEDIPNWNPAWRRRYRTRMGRVCRVLASRHGYVDGWLEAQRDLHQVDDGVTLLEAYANGWRDAA